MSFDSGGWDYILDREIDTLLCEISADLNLVILNKIRRGLEQHIAFKVPAGTELTRIKEVHQCRARV